MLMMSLAECICNGYRYISMEHIVTSSQGIAYLYK